MNHSLNYSNYIEKIKNESNQPVGEGVLSDDPVADHFFDPVAFYSSIEDEISVKIGSEPAATSLTTISTQNLRRSGRPKPAAEALISSPPAIKFYESTVIRNKPSTKTKKRSSSSSNLFTNDDDVKSVVNGITGDVNDSPMLKLRLPMRSQSSSKENISDKRNLRVVKLMMPDITAEEAEDESINANPPANVKSAGLPVLAPKPPKQSSDYHHPQTLSFPLKIIKKQRTSKSGPEPAINPETKTIVNEDVCSSCDGLGNFICCDACPRSFHFTCAQPPLDPLNLPDDDWFCCECQHRQQQEAKSSPSTAETASIWGKMLREAERMNPKCFVMPRRFRFQPKEDDLQKLLSGQLIPIERETRKEPQIQIQIQNHIQQHQNQNQNIHTKNTTTGSCIVINELVELDHCSIKTPNISNHKSSQGYCHCCGRYGLTRSALQKSSEDPSIPCDLRLQRPILSCNICPLYWHLDCLDPPRASFPSNADSGWTCPIHFTTEKCLALELAESLVQSTLLLPEAAIKRQLEHKIKRDGDKESDDNISEICVNVPEVIKQFYK